MTPADAAAMYRRQIALNGEEVTLRRIVPNAAPINVTVMARVTGYQPQELTDGIDQGDRKVILLADDVSASGFPVPIKLGGSDKIIVRGRTLNVQSVDDTTRSVAGQVIAYEIQARG